LAGAEYPEGCFSFYLRVAVQPLFVSGMDLSGEGESAYQIESSWNEES
jgi:hypothetical protein